MSAAPLLVTMGDPSGIGPELVARAHLAGELRDAVVVGEPSVFWRGMQACVGPAQAGRDLAGGGGPRFAEPAAAPDGRPVDWAKLPWGRVDARCGTEAARCVRAAVALIRAGKGRAIVTAPIHKEALAAAGVPFPGHTEMLQAWATPGDSCEVRMMLANDELRVVLVTVHQSLRTAIDAITFERVLQTILLTDRSLRDWGLQSPRIAVSGLNPHAGEGGLFGSEEAQVIRPAVEAAVARGVAASGPFPPDTVFMRARGAPGRPGAWDAVVAMTHDHGLIPIKYLGLAHGVNITLGLPFPRTSPDHGTAFDIAGQGVAEPGGFLAALAWARRLAPALG